MVLAIIGFAGVVLVGGHTGGSGQTSVVVAAHDIQLRQTLTAEDLQVVKYDTNDAPPGYYTATKPLIGEIAAVAFTAGQPILRNLVSTSGVDVVTGTTSYLPIPTGFVAVTIPSAEQQAVAGYVQTGDYISIIAVVQGKQYPVARTIFTQVHVIRVGPATTDTSNAASGTLGSTRSAGVTSSLTVLVSECDAEYLSWFLSYATVRYTLESYQDYESQATQPDATCPSVTAAHGVTGSDVAKRWPGLLTS